MAALYTIFTFNCFGYKCDICYLQSGSPVNEEPGHITFENDLNNILLQCRAAEKSDAKIQHPVKHIIVTLALTQLSSMTSRLVLFVSCPSVNKFSAPCCLSHVPVQN